MVVDGSAGSGSGGMTGAGGAVACTEVYGLCQAWCGGCGAKESDACLGNCLGYYEAFYPVCSDTYAALLACQVQHMNDAAGCAGVSAACSATEEPHNVCRKANPTCEGFSCAGGCVCKTSCSTVFGSSCADGMCSCSIGGTVVGTCAENCMSANLATCCAALFFQTCPP